MTFDEWYKDNFPGDWNLAILAKSPPAIERYQIAYQAWWAGYADVVEAMGGPVDH